MFRSHHITLLLADERRRELIHLGEALVAPRRPELQPEHKTENRFVESAEQDAVPEARPLDPASTRSSRRAAIRVWRRELRTHTGSTATEHAIRELDRV